MTSTEVLVIVGGVALGYWLVAVVWPLLSGRDNESSTSADGERPWHEVLGVPANADRAAIDAAHQSKRAEHLPERIAHLSADARAQAQRRRMQIDRAYAQAMRRFN